MINKIYVHTSCDKIMGLPHKKVIDPKLYDKKKEKQNSVNLNLLICENKLPQTKMI